MMDWFRSGTGKGGGGGTPSNGRGGGGGCPVKTTQDSAPPSSNTGCPVKHDGTAGPGTYNPATGDLRFGQERQPNQVVDLSTERIVSSIPKSDLTPAHQPNGLDRWVYPSEQQYFNAMKRKGYDPAEHDIPVILAIHNIVNEEGWSKVKEWESLRGEAAPKLKQFLGRPKDVSPKAFFMSLLGYKLPFDRHDWIIDRNGHDVRYVIDFYKGSQPAGGRAAIAMYLDVRPALDSHTAVIDRVSVAVRQALGLSVFNPGVKHAHNTSPPPSQSQSSPSSSPHRPRSS